jgi:hypothetical protein
VTRTARLCSSVLVGLLVVAQAGQSAASELTAPTTVDQRVAISLTGRIVAGDAERFRSLTLPAHPELGGRPCERGSQDRADGSRLRHHHPGWGRSDVRVRLLCHFCGRQGEIRREWRADRNTLGLGSGKRETSMAMTMAMAYFLNSYGVPEQVIERMRVTAPDKIAWLSGDELRSMGVTMLAGTTPASPLHDQNRKAVFQWPAAEMPNQAPSLGGTSVLPFVTPAIQTPSKLSGGLLPDASVIRRGAATFQVHLADKQSPKQSGIVLYPTMSDGRNLTIQEVILAGRREPYPIGYAGHYVAWVSSQRSKVGAETAFRELQRKYPTMLAGRQPLIRLGDTVSSYYVQVGPFLTIDEVSELCTSMNTAGDVCMVKRIGPSIQ